MADQYRKMPAIELNIIDAKSVNCSTSTTVSEAKFRALWLDPNLGRKEVMAATGMCKSTVWLWAKRLNLPRKRMGRTEVANQDQLRALWLAGIGIAEIAGFFSASESTIFKATRRMALPSRRPGTRPEMTLAQFRDTLLAKAMARDAAAEQRQMILAEMADCIGSVRPVGAEKGRAA
jgi:predicted DNA-binding transcriptional regulator AlpA